RNRFHFLRITFHVKHKGAYVRASQQLISLPPSARCHTRYRALSCRTDTGRGATIRDRPSSSSGQNWHTALSMMRVPHPVPDLAPVRETSGSLQSLQRYGEG